ncbi:hypothetical protein PR202_ga11593 [Eleusine coracana subsp. coracana]|uniref:UBC core domain-containing protein n=1 Tax=Eleusine coracana subsp. coracana TaxID=191504 RepID=A0AAV5C9W9_ELECO|nr:hypothetical protein PR202_ga11593 [Eleusine coracana subsp. coracana]
MASSSSTSTCCPPHTPPCRRKFTTAPSFGLNLNPNLDESGTVCLSLLDTFGGEGVELWSPTVSSVLQVVVSIQGLVLTSQPFYNEHSYKAHYGTPNGARNEVVFTEGACLLTLRTMLHLLRQPPAGFEEIVRGHFRQRGEFVLRACHKGCPVGMLDAEAHAVIEESTGGGRARRGSGSRWPGSCRGSLRRSW